MERSRDEQRRGDERREGGEEGGWGEEENLNNKASRLEDVRKFFHELPNQSSKSCVFMTGEDGRTQNLDNDDHQNLYSKQQSSNKKSQQKSNLRNR